MQKQFLDQNGQPQVSYAALKNFASQMLENAKSQYADDAFNSLIETLNKLAEDECALDHYDMAKDCLKLIIELCTENNADKNIKIITDTLQNLLLIFVKQGKDSYAEAENLFLEYYQKFKKAYKKETSLPKVYAYYCLGEIAMKAKNYDKARSYYERILTKHNSPSSTLLPEQDLANAYANLGSILLYQGRFEQSQSYLQKALLIFSKHYSDTDEKIVQVKEKIHTALINKLHQQSDKKFKDEVFVLVGEENLIHHDAYLSVPPCFLSMSIQYNEIVFSFKGSPESIKVLREILNGSQGLLRLMNEASQFGKWSVSDNLPCIEPIPSEDAIHLFYVDKKVENIFQDNIAKEFYVRSGKLKEYFQKHRSEIWYQALAELSCYFHLPLLSQPENQMHNIIRKLGGPKDENLSMDLGLVRYVLKQDTYQLLNLPEQLQSLLVLIQNPKVNAKQAEAIQAVVLFPVKKLMHELQTQGEHEVEAALNLVDQHLNTLKDLLFQIYSGQEQAPELTLEQWSTLTNCLQLLSFFKGHLVRHQLSLQRIKQNALLEREKLQQQEDYKNLQQSKKVLLKGQQGPYIVADKNYPERNHKGWPFNRTFEKIKRLHGPWNVRSTLDDKKMYAEQQNRFDFDKVLQKNEIVVDFGAGNGNFLRDLRKRYADLDLYLVAMGIDPLDDANLPFIDEIWYMPLALADHLEEFVKRFKGKVGLITCTFGPTTYAFDPKLVVILAAYIARRGGHISLIISSQPGHYDGTPLGYADDREDLAAFIKKYLGMTMITHWTSIESAVVANAKFIDFKLDISRPLDAPEITYSLPELFELAHIEIGLSSKLPADPNHPYQFKTQSIEMRQYLRAGETPRNNLLEIGHIKQTLLDIIPVKDFGLVFKIILTLESGTALEKIFKKVNERIASSSNEIIPNWTVEKNVLQKNLTISYVEPNSHLSAYQGNFQQHLAYLASDPKNINVIWINVIETLFYNGIVIPNVTEKIDSVQYPVLLPDRFPMPAPEHVILTQNQLSVPHHPSLHLRIIPEKPVPHPETGKPVFTFHLIGQYEGFPSEHKGTLSLYGERGVCQLNGRLNILYADGMFATTEINIDEITNVCASLPPTLTEKFLTSAIDGGIHGVIKGATNMYGNNVGTRYALTNFTKQLIIEGVYYFTYFNYRFISHSYSNWHNDEMNAYESGYQALADTANLCLVNAGVIYTQGLAKLASKQAKAYGCDRLSKKLDGLEKYIPFTLFGLTAVVNSTTAFSWERSKDLYKAKKYLDFAFFTAKEYLLPGLTGMATGTATQTAVELAGKKLLPTVKPKQL